MAGALKTDFALEDPETETAILTQPAGAEGDSFGPYRILRVLGEGGMGTVYLAEQTEPIRRRVALKVVKPGMDTGQVLARFNQERRSLARMEHSHIARILDAGASSRGRPFFVMDYIEGLSITAYCDAHQLTTAQRLELFLPVCRAVQHAHARGIIHRDIKPSNVLVTEEDGKPVPKVIDFGIARAMDAGEPGHTLSTEFGQMVGTPEYASPEQADLVSGEISAATDVYSLGVLLYEMLAGAVPFEGALLRKAGFAEMLRMIREQDPPSLAERFNALGPAAREAASRRGTDAASLRNVLAGSLNRIVKKALEKSPPRRYGSPAELAADIERYLKGEPVLAGPGRRPRVRKALAGAAAVLVLISAAWLLWRGFEARPAAPSRVAATVVLSDLVNNAGEAGFESSFRQTISFELQRSRSLAVLPEGRVTETLGLMRRAPSTPLAPEIAREICQRTGSAAVIESSLSRMGTGYMVALRARNCAAGEAVDEEQARASGKDEVLNELRGLTVALQRKSAATLAALQKKAVPLDAVTTNSLEALRSFEAARQRSYASPTESLLLFERATEIDPQFAVAYAWLGRAYSDTGEQRRAMDNISKSYALRGLASDWENFFITYNYDRDVLRNLELARRVCEAWIEKYPNDMMPHGFLSGFTTKGRAQYEKSIEEGERAVAMNPGFTVGYQNVAESYLYLNRPAQARAIIERAMQRKLPSNDRLAVQFFVAFLERDRGAMDRVHAQLTVASPFGIAEHIEALLSAYQGRVQQSRQASAQAVTLAQQAHLAERAAMFQGAAAVREALLGSPEESRRLALAAGEISHGRDSDFPPAFALALTRDSAAAAAIATRLETEYPEDTCVRFVYSPVLRGLLALNRGEPAKAIELLALSQPYDLAQTGVGLYFYYGVQYPTYVRGLAYQQLHKNREAAVEFQRMLDHPGLLLTDPIAPAARLQLARALRDAGDLAAARSAYADLLAEWKDADPDLPLLRQARSEAQRM